MMYQHYHNNFSEHLAWLKITVSNIEEWFKLIHKEHPHIRDIQAGLHHSDPFIVYKASQAAEIFIRDNLLPQ